MNARPKNVLAQTSLTGGTRNKQGSTDARVLTIVPLSCTLIKSHKYQGQYY